MLTAIQRRYAGERSDAWRALGVSKLVTPPTDEPVTVETLKRHSRLSDSDIDYDLLPLRIAAAREWAEHYTGRAFMTQTWSYTLDRLVEGTVPILLPRVPVIDITSVKTYDPDGVETTVATNSYRLETQSIPARLFLTTDVGYWAADPRFYGGMVVTYRAGYGTTEESVPASIRHAILLLAAEFSERLEGATDLKLTEIPFGVRALLDLYVVTV